MKQLFTRSKTLLFVIAALIVGANATWADTLTEGFETVSVTKNGEAAGNQYGDGLSNGWVVVGGSIYQSSGSTNYGLWSNGANKSSKSLEASYGPSNSASVVITTKLSGTFTFWARKTSTKSDGYLTLYKATEDNGTYTVTSEAISTTISSLTTTWTEYTADLGDDGVYVAINMIRAAIDDISCEKYVEGSVKKPKNLAVADGVTYNSATLTWTAGGEETNWQVAYGITEDFDVDASTKYDVTTTSYEMTGLTENTTYYACVRSKVGDEYSAWTSKVNFTTPVQFPVPTAFALAGFTSTSASFSWTAGSTESAWQIAYSSNADFDPASATTVDVTTNPYTLEGLTAETTYYACIRANYGTGYSNWSEKVSFTPSNTMETTINDVNTTTSKYIPVYGNWVDNVNYNKSQFIITSALIPIVNNREITKLTFFTSSTTAVTWAGNVFDVYMKEISETAVSTTFDRSGTKVFTGSLSVNAQGLMEIILDEGFHYTGSNLLIGFDMTTSGTYKDVSFYGVNGGSSMYTSNGSGNASTFLPKMTITSIPFVAAAVEKPKALAVSAVTATTASLSWTDGEEGLTAWEIKYSTDEDFDPATEGTAVEADANPYTLTGLTAETTYYAYVRAKKGTDYSDWSNMVEFMPTASVQLTVNDGTQTNSYVPVYGNYVDNYDKVEFIIPASSVDAIDGGTIKGLTFYLSSPASASWGAANFKVYMKEVEETTISDYHFTDSDTPLYDGALDGTQATMVVTLTTPYVYNGGNLLVGFYNTAKGSYKSASFYGVTAEYGASVYGNNGTSLASVTTVNKQSFLPKTTFTYLPGTPKAQMVVTPASIDFGTLSSASDAADFQQTFTIANASKKVDLTSLAVNCTGEGFSVSNLNSTTIAANGEAIELTVTFAPTTDKDYNGTITVTGSDENEATITLKGIYSNTPATMAVTDENDVDVNGTTVAFGSKGRSITKTFTVTNDGDLTLNATIASNNTDFFTVPATIEVAGHSSENFDVTFVWANSNLDVEQTATITLTAGDLTKSFTVTGTRTEQWSEDFADDPTIDRGWSKEGSWSFADGKAVSNGISGYLITPELTVAGETDELNFEYEATKNNAYIEYSYKAKGSNSWTTKYFPANYATTYTGFNNGDKGTLTITGLEAGTYQFRFRASYYTLDNFEGFKLFVAEHDAEITAQNIPTTGYENQAYTATVTVKEKAGKAETGVVAKLYINDVEKATDNQDLTANGETTFTLTFTPTEAISGTAQIVVTYEDVTLNSTTATVNIKAIDVYDENATDNEIVTSSNYSRTIQLNRTFINGWNTVCLPFQITSVSSFFGSTVKAYEFNDYNEETGLKFKKVTEMTGGKPYLLWISESVNVDAMSNMFLENQWVPAAEPIAVTKEPITFQGTFQKIAAGSLTGNYVLTTEAKIAKAGAGASMKAFRAYFVAGDGARMTISFDDNTTGIGVITTDGELEVGTLYNLKGQKVQGTQKGLYIINGKKVVVK